MNKGVWRDWTVHKYHLIEPGRLTMCERKQVAQKVAGMVKKCRELWPLCEVYYLTMFPRHTDRCCDSRGHMAIVGV